MRTIAPLMPAIIPSLRKAASAEFSDEWPYKPVQLMRDLVKGRLTLVTVHIQRVGLDWFESDDYNVFINKETGEDINDF